MKYNPINAQLSAVERHRYDSKATSSQSKTLDHSLFVYEFLESGGIVSWLLLTFSTQFLALAGKKSVESSIFSFTATYTVDHPLSRRRVSSDITRKLLHI